MGRAVLKRIRDFAAGRSCARLALAQFGITDFALRVAEDRRPVWPSSVVGSISHTEGLCVAAVGRRNAFLSVGIDCEVVGHVTSELHATIFTEAEAAWVDSVPDTQREAASTLIFSAKEAFYKCQYPLTGEWLDFADLEIQPVDLTRRRATFQTTPTRPIAVTGLIMHPMSSEYLFTDGFVTTSVTFQRNARCQ